MTTKYKIIIICLLIIIIAVLGYFAFRPQEGMAPVAGPTSTSTSTSSTNTKLNIDVVCQSALSYMTFENAASADAFVTECKEGKHPEVIERYKADMNLGDGATI